MHKVLFARLRETLPVILLATMPVLMLYAGGLRWNVTASAPRGFYAVTDPAQASYLSFCPDDGGLSAQRGYRPYGLCPDLRESILKPITAKPGKWVRVTPQGTWIDGRLLPNTAPLAVDSRGRTLTPWPFGDYRLGLGEFWTVSSYDPRSYDSRYFGPVRTRGCSYLQPFWTEASR